ncbi:MAG: hypothetical protein O3B87_04825 [bacterium]|nr:hypothetical protein [bacterium]
MKRKFNRLVILLLFTALLVYTRFVGLDWGMPYPMHPDERNMVMAIHTIQCTDGINLDCLNPHFWAYGQLPLYLARGIMWVSNNLIPATMALRILSALSSLATVFVLIKALRLLVDTSQFRWYLSSTLFIYSPVLIQFSHFGTTESILMLATGIVFYLSIRFIQKTLSSRHYILYAGVVLGIAVGIKVSALLLAIIPFFTFIVHFTRSEEKNLMYTLFSLFRIAVIMMVFFIIASPYNVIEFQGFIHSMNYESSVGTGEYRAFYTRSFEYALPGLFQLVNIFPFALGIPVMLLGLWGFLTLSWRRPEFNILRIVIILLFIPNALLYAKWTRFLAPFFPLFILMATVSFAQILKQVKYNVLCLFITLTVITPGIAFVTIYQHPDVRFSASSWIYNNIPNDSFILFETANVVDVPIPNPQVDPNVSSSVHYQTDSFNYYDLDIVPELEDDLKESMEKADYIIVPSRRVFANHGCVVSSKLNLQSTKINPKWGYEKQRCEKLEEAYPLVNRYYDELLNTGRFEYVTSFSSFPRIELFGKTLIEFPDEQAEETWTVFDHPVIRIYKKV